MKNYTKAAAFLLSATTLLSLASCGGGGESSESETGKITETEVVSAEKTDTQAEETVFTDTESETESETETEEKVVMIETPDEVDALLSSIAIFKFNSPYAVINGTRVDMGAEAIFYEYVLIPADFAEEMKLCVAEEDDYFEKDGVRYVKSAEPYRRAGKVMKILSGSTDSDKIVISDTDYKVSAEIMDEYARRLENMYALGKVYSAKMTGNRPVLFETDEMLSFAKEQAKAKAEPYYSSAQQITLLADNALAIGARPYTEASATQYRLAACRDMVNARNLALAYLYTENERYLDGALSFLKLYAEQKLGTDKHLDYSAPKGDGQADIGLNIALPLTAACDVYAMLYNHISDADKTVIEKWIADGAELCVKGHKYWIKNNNYGSQEGNNHLTCHLMGIIAAAYVLEDDELLNYAVAYENNPSCLQEMVTRAILMDGDEVYGADIDENFLAGEIYDRYRSVQNNGFGYAMYHLKFLTYSALMLHHNGLDLFTFMGEKGENLLLPFRFYADYLIQNDITLNGGPYANDKGLNRESAYSIYCIANYIYGDEIVQEVLDAFADQKVRCDESEILGVSSVYIYGNE